MVDGTVKLLKLLYSTPSSKCCNLYNKLDHCLAEARANRLGHPVYWHSDHEHCTSLLLPVRILGSHYPFLRTLTARVQLETWNLVHRRRVAICPKPAKKNLEKGRDLGHVTPIIFGVHPNVSRKRVELETWNLVHRCIVAISQKAAKKNLEKGRGLGHVTLRICGIPQDVSRKPVNISANHCLKFCKLNWI